MTKQDRVKILKKNLSIHIDKSFYCPCLKAYVLVTKESVKETIFWASLSDKSTKLATELPEVIKNAEIIKTNLPPKPGKQTKKFYFSQIFLLKSKIQSGTAKLTVGYKKSGKFIEYCITNFYKT